MWYYLRLTRRLLIQINSKRKRPISLSVTHKLSTKPEAECDIRQPGHAAPDDDVARRGITPSVEIAAEACNLSQAGSDRGGSSAAGDLPIGSKASEEIDFQRRERQGRPCGFGHAIEHRQPKDPPTQDAEQSQEIDEALGRAKPGSFGCAAGFQGLVEDLDL